MMFGLSLNFADGGYSFNSPTALWWKQLATAVVFGLGIATILTLVFTPAMLALRIWISTYLTWLARMAAKLSEGRASRAAQDWALAQAAKRVPPPEILWEDEPELPLQTSDGAASQSDASSKAVDKSPSGKPLRAAE